MYKMLMSLKYVGIVILFCVCAKIAQAQDVDAVLYDVDSLSDNPEMALEILNRAFEENPDSEELLKIRADAYEILKLYDKAVADYSRLVQSDPDDESLWYLLGRNQFMNGQLQEAMVSLNRSTNLNSKLLPAFHTKIQVLMELQQYEAALKVSDSTLNIAVTAMTYFLHGEVNRKLKKWQIAEWAYSSAVRIDKGFIEAYIAWANIAADTNKATETLEAAEAALRIDPDSKEALIARSRGFALSNDYFNAIEDVSYIIEIDPNNVDARFWRGTYYKNTNKPQDAIRDFNEVLKFQPDNWQAIAGRADSYAQTGNKTVALEGYQTLLSIADNHPDKDAIIQFANLQIFELYRENNPPVLTLTEPATESLDISVTDDLKAITINGKITDESQIKSLVINGQNVPVLKIDENFEFAALVALENIEEIKIEVSDVYDNTSKVEYKIVRINNITEIIEIIE